MTTAALACTWPDRWRRPATAAARWAAAVVLALFTAAAVAQTWESGTDGLAPIPPLAARVTDLTGTLTADEKRTLEAKLADWEARTGNQLAVLVVPSTQPEPIETYSIRVAEQWKIGRKGNDNGVLFTVAKNDRKLRLEVGYGLEGVLTDVTASRIIRETVAPLFREGKFTAGIDAGVDRIIGVVAEGKPLPPPKAARAGAPSFGGFDFGTLLLILFIVVPLIGAVLRSIFGRLLGSTVGAGIIGTAAWFVAGSIAVAVVAAIVAFAVMIFAAAGSAFGGRRGGGVGFPTGGGFGGGGFGGGGGGFSGGGGSFGGGGASGGW